VVMLCGTARAQDVGPISHEGIDLRVGGLMRTNYNAKGQLGDPETIENAIRAPEDARLLQQGKE
jgi:hypothetical protein